MGRRRLYNLALPNDVQTQSQSQIQRNITTQGTLRSSGGDVTPVSMQPGQQLLTGQYRARYAELMRDQIEELFDSQTISVVPFFEVDRDAKIDGYYSLSNTDAGAIDPRQSGAQDFDGVLEKVGTRNSHFRTVETNTQQVDHDFGTDERAYIGIDYRAKTVRWFNQVTQEKEKAEPVETVTSQFGEVDLYDLEDASWWDIEDGGENPTLFYSLPYEREGRDDLRCYDTFDRDKREIIEDGDTTVSEDTTVGDDTEVDGERIISSTWQLVFDESHDFSGDIVIENGVLRLEIREDEFIRAYNWSGDGQQLDDPVHDESFSYNPVNLDDTDFVPADVDITRIGTTRIDVQIEFEDDSEIYDLNLSLQRGFDKLYVTIPNNEDPPIPQDLEDLFDPIAETSLSNPTPSADVVKRKKTQR